MSFSVTMPALGESVTEGTITRWLKQEGDQVEVDEPLLEISTDKVDTEIPSPAAGILTKIVAAEDDTVEVGAELAVIGGEGESAPAAAPAPAAQPEAAPAQAAPAAPAQPEAAAPAATPAPSSDAADGTPVTMPALGESVTEGTITRWLKNVGDDVAVDEPLLEISTDKVDTEIPSPVAGKLLQVVANEDDTVEVGGTLAIIGSGSAASASAAPTPAAPAPAAQAPAPPAPPAPTPPTPAAPVAPPAPAAPAQTAPAPQQPVANNGGPSSAGGIAGYVTPLVRKLANENGVDLASVRGTGVGGRIRKQDVLQAAQSAKPAAQPAAAPSAAPTSTPPAVSPLRGTTEKMTRIRKTIAVRMVESLQTAAQLTSVVEVDVTKIAHLRREAKNDFQARHGVKLSFLPFFALAAVEALRAHPKLNSTVDMEAGTVTYHAAENLSIAVDNERGLVAPVIQNAGDLNLGGLARKIADLADRTRNNKLSPDELAGGTFTVTNTGSRGALLDTPIVNLPQSAILGTGAVVKRAVVVDDPNLGELIVPRSMMYLSLSYDHRVVDGADAARYLVAVKERLEAGAFQSELGLS
ncbi:MAG: 2-oxoglutarate dehydrogenase, E2 component, dihydrolipoamide succinyltransferase [Corynebacteriales bacterium]|nr:2-oxoglutarate dehydrogenase, E2 component, dihydrolipoamide succinyltransferase [Mycobacteriales bacterium]